MNGLQILGVVIMVVAGLWAMGMLPTAGLLSLYRRIRLMGLLWALAMALIAAGRIFDFP